MRREDVGDKTTGFPPPMSATRLNRPKSYAAIKGADSAAAKPAIASRNSAASSAFAWRSKIVLPKARSIAAFPVRTHSRKSDQSSPVASRRRGRRSTPCALRSRDVTSE